MKILIKHLLLILPLLAAALPSRAATYTVTNTSNAGPGSLREAINQANANPGADTIDFDTAGVFSTSQYITLTTGQLVITGALTIDAPTAQAKRVRVAADFDSRVLRIALATSGTVMLKHLDIREGTTTDDGGGIQMASPAGSTLELQDCTIYGCHARDGGGIDAQDATLVLTNTNFIGCTATRNGGGVITRGDVTMTGCECDGTADADGGGIYANGATVAITGTVIGGGRAGRGGGVFAKAGATLSMTDGSIRSNFVTGNGGGIHASGSSSVTLLRVHVERNEAEYGGGIDMRSSTLVATNCVFARNTASASGGGIYFRSGTARLKNCTVTRNVVSSSGFGIVAETGGLSMGNTVVQNNGSAAFVSSGTDDLSGSFLSLGHNLIGDIGAATGFTNGVDGDIVGGAGAPPVDARLDYSYYMPEARSRCLEGGDSALLSTPPYGPPPFIDIEGNPRIRGVVDIGAFEADFTALITNDADSGPGSLRAALTSSPTDISFDPAFFGTALRTITLTSGPINLSTNLSIVGPAPGVRISGNNSSRIFTISGGEVSLKRVRIIDGSASGDGGGIRVLNNGTTLTLDDAGVSNSTATGRGGGLYVQDAATVFATNSTFSGNVADGDGGGIHVNGATLNITNSTISTNDSKQGGGGIYAGGSGTTTVVNCTIADNTCDSDNVAPVGNGGGIRRHDGTVTVGNSIVARNTDASSATVHPDVSGVFVSLGHNLIGKIDGIDSGSGTPFQNGVNGDLAGTIASPLAPGLNALQQNPASTPTRVHPLQSGSPARDAGDSALLSHSAWPFSPVAQDQRGQFRIVGTSVDIGAVEYPDTNLVTLTAGEIRTSERTLDAVSFRIRRSYDDGAALVVQLTIDPSTTASAGDYALSGASYTSTGASTFTITIPAGKTSVLLTMTPLQDATVENVEFLALALAAGAGYGLDSAAPAAQSVTIYDDEYTVTTNANSGAGTLREAINNANAGGGGVITIPANTNITLNGGELTITSEIEIHGNHSTVNANGLSRVFYIQHADAAPVVLRDLIITGGVSSDNGAGVNVFDYANLDMIGCTVKGNVAQLLGGGVFADYQSTVTLTDCAIVDNSSNSSGGGIATYNATVEMANVTVAANQARSSGGGLYLLDGEFDATQCTITENVANSAGLGGPSANGGGMSLVFPDSFGLTNTVIAGNFDSPGNAGGGTIHPDISGSANFPFMSHCFVGNNAGITSILPGGSPGANGNYVGTSAAPFDAALRRIDRPVTTYYEFAFGSELFDNGQNAFATTASDQRGYARIYNGRADIGAVEMDFVGVSNANSTGVGSLRQALVTAAGIGHGTVVFDPLFFSVPRTISPGANGELVITSDVVIAGPTAPTARLSISGENADRVFRIAPVGSATVEFRNLDIINGSTAGYAAGNRFGAGVALTGLSNLMMTGCVIRNCAALTQSGAVDVGVGATLAASECTFSTNSAGTTGGAITNLGEIAITRSTFNNNTAGTEGAALANAGNGTLTNCTFSNNRANNNGGAIYNLTAASDVLTLTHCTLTLNRSNDDNTGGGNGGGIRLVSGIVNVRNTIIYGNDALGNNQDDISGAFSSLGNNLIGTADGATGFTHGVNGDLVGANPHLGPLQFNGGSTMTHALRIGSAAIDTATAVAVGAIDQRFMRRNAGPPDIGAYELVRETYAYWASHIFSNPANTGLTDDYDGDGRSNALEFGAGTDPTDARSTPNIGASRIGDDAAFDFTASPLAPGRFAALRYSTDLVTWQDVPEQLYQIAGYDPVRNVILYRVIIPLITSNRLFVRLERMP